MTLALARPALDGVAAAEAVARAASGTRLERSAGEQPGGGRRRSRRAPAPLAFDIVDQWAIDSFPASDPPANW